MCPREVEGNSFVIGCKPVGSEGSTGSFKGIEGFLTSFDLVIAFPVDQELAFLVIDSILENLLNFPFFLSCTIDSNRLFGGAFRES